MPPHTLIYLPPAGPRVPDAKLSDILDNVRSKGADYWNAESAHGTIYLNKQGGAAPSLTLLYVKAFDSFYIEVSFAELFESRQCLVAYIPDAQIGRTEVASPWAGQNPMRIPRDFCVSREKCAEIVTAFCLRSELDSGTNWIKRWEADWDFNPDDE